MVYFGLKPCFWLVFCLCLVREPDPRRTVTDTKIMYKNVTKTDAQVFQCNATNKHGYIFANAYLNVLGKPERLLNYLKHKPNIVDALPS